MMETTGVIAFATSTQYALWQREIRGQLSDGMWENSRPFEHWRPWCNLVPVITDGLTYVKFGSRYPTKVKYALLRLCSIPEIEQRMIIVGRMALADITVSTHGDGGVRALERFLENGGDEDKIDHIVKLVEKRAAEIEAAKAKGSQSHAAE